MKKKPSLAILKGLLFTYSTENTKDLEREEIIASKNINNKADLAELFDILTKPEFLLYKKDEQLWFIETIEHYLSINEDFEAVFYLFDTYFEDDISDKKDFMRVLLKRLKNYYSNQNQEAKENLGEN